MTDVRISSLYFGFNLSAKYPLEIPRRSLGSLCRNDISQTRHPEERSDVRIYIRYYELILTAKYIL